MLPPFSFIFEFQSRISVPVLKYASVPLFNAPTPKSYPPPLSSPPPNVFVWIETPGMQITGAFASFSSIFVVSDSQLLFFFHILHCLPQIFVSSTSQSSEDFVTQSFRCGIDILLTLLHIAYSKAIKPTLSPRFRYFFKSQSFRLTQRQNRLISTRTMAYRSSVINCLLILMTSNLIS